MAKYKLILSKLVSKDLDRIANYSTNSKFKIMRRRLKEVCRNLIEMPRMYPRLYYEKNSKTDFRKIVCENYIIIYKIQKNQITIIKIASEKENYLKPKLLEIY